MPLMPAIRPSESSSHIAERPNNTPPVSGIRCAFISVTLPTTNHLQRVSDRRRMRVELREYPLRGHPEQAVREGEQEGVGLR